MRRNVPPDRRRRDNAVRRWHEEITIRFPLARRHQTAEMLMPDGHSATDVAGEVATLSLAQGGPVLPEYRRGGHVLDGPAGHHAPEPSSKRTNPLVTCRAS